MNAFKKTHALRDMVIAAGLIGLAAFAGAEVWGMPGNAAMFPLAMCGLVVLAALSILVEAALKLRDATVHHVPVVTEEMDAEDVGPAPIAWGLFALLIAIIVVYALIIPWLGFYPASFLCLLAIFSLRSGLGLTINFAIAVCTVAILYVVFSLLLAIPMPIGKIAGLF